MKHTQGPWTTRTAFKHGEPIESVIQAGTEVLASAYDLGSDQLDEMEANARLIAAAPELLEALDKTIEVFVDLRHAQGFSMDDEEEETYRHALLVIAKTEDNDA
jgi:hypothetical protein